MAPNILVLSIMCVQLALCVCQKRDVCFPEYHLILFCFVIFYPLIIIIIHFLPIIVIISIIIIII